MELDEARRYQSSRASSPSEDGGLEAGRHIPAIRTAVSPFQSRMSLDLGAVSSPGGSSSGYIKARTLFVKGPDEGCIPIGQLSTSRHAISLSKVLIKGPDQGSMQAEYILASRLHQGTHSVCHALKSWHCLPASLTPSHQLHTAQAPPNSSLYDTRYP